MRAFPLIAFALAAATACGSPAGSAGPLACTAIGTPVGIGIDLSPPVAARVVGVTLVACWAGNCTTRTVELNPTSSAGTTICTGENPSDSCSAPQTPTGGKQGFADLPGLPASPVRITLTLDGGRAQTLDITPKVSYPNGPHCGGGGPQVQLIVAADGVATERG
jgi:hypothetical protein